MGQQNNIVEFYNILQMSVRNHLGNDIDFMFSTNPETELSFSETGFISSIEINGVLNGELYIFTSKRALEFILGKAYSMDYSELESQGLIQDSLNEFLNEIIANSTEQLSEAKITIDIGVPSPKDFGTIKEFRERFKTVLKINAPDDAFYLILVEKCAT